MTGPRYTVTTRLNDRTIAFRAIEDPFVTTTTTIGWPDLLRGLLRRRLQLTVLVDADGPTVAAVMNLKRTEGTSATAQSDDAAAEMACDWSDYRKEYGVSADDKARSREHQAFTAGWKAAKGTLDVGGPLR